MSETMEKLQYYFQKTLKYDEKRLKPWGKPSNNMDWEGPKNAMLPVLFMVAQTTMMVTIVTIVTSMKRRMAMVTLPSCAGS